MRTVVGEASVKVPEPLPLNGAECVAKAVGNAPRTARRPKTLRITSFIDVDLDPWSSYKGSFSERKDEEKFGAGSSLLARVHLGRKRIGNGTPTKSPVSDKEAFRRCLRSGINPGVFRQYSA